MTPSFAEKDADFTLHQAAAQQPQQGQAGDESPYSPELTEGMDFGVIVALPESNNGSRRSENAGEEATRQIGEPHLPRDVLQQQSSPEMQVERVVQSVEGYDARLIVQGSIPTREPSLEELQQPQQGLVVHYIGDPLSDVDTEDDQPPPGDHQESITGRLEREDDAPVPPGSNRRSKGLRSRMIALKDTVKGRVNAVVGSVHGMVATLRSGGRDRTSEWSPRDTESIEDMTEETNGPAFVTSRSNSATAASQPRISNTSKVGEDQDQTADCVSCDREFTNSKGLAQHNRRDANNPCAQQRAEIINEEQNVPTPVIFKTHKKRLPQRNEDRGGRGGVYEMQGRKKLHKTQRAPPDKPPPQDPAASSPATEDKQTMPESQQRRQMPTTINREALHTHNQPATARCQRKEPIIRRKVLRVPRLTADANARLQMLLKGLALETKAKVETGTWEEVEAATAGFTDKIYDAVWFADKLPNEAKPQGLRQKASGNSEHQENRKARVSPRLAQAQDNVKKALLALREEEKAQQGQKDGDPLDKKLKKRALERQLRTARRRLINVIKEESAQNLQALYTRDRRKCVEQLLADEDQPRSQDCPIQLSELEEHFRAQHSEQPIDPTSQAAREFLEPLAAAPEGAHGLDPYFTEDDVRAQLQKCNLKSAAGPDGIGFFVYKRFDEVLVPALTAIYNACSQHRKVPARWKESVTVLIPKGGDPKDVKNWRPINLQDCIYKLYAALWANKITKWAIKTGVASKSQKGFMPVNGCHEHLFLAQSILHSTRRSKKSLYMTYYDLKNAFGSISHELIHVVLKAQRLPQQAREVITDLYDGASFCISTKEGVTGRIENRRGVKQGCPLSPILFNLAIEPLLQRLAACNEGLELRTTDGKPPIKVSHMAYADDLKTVASTRKGIHSLHQVVEGFLRWTGLQANPSKCATLGWKVDKTKQRPDPVELKLHGEVLPVVKLGEAYKYLGIKDAIQTSVHLGQILQIMSKAKKDIIKLLRSALLPWQKLDALRTFVMSRLDYHLRHCYPYKQHLIAFDRHIRAVLKAEFKLGKGTATNVFHQPTSDGGMGCPSIQMIATATQIGHAIQMLNSSDSMIRAVAEGQVLEVIKRAYIYKPENETSDREAILAYLNRRDIGCLKRRGKKVDIRSLWSELPGNLSTSKTQIETGSDGSYIVKKADGSDLDQKNIIRSIKQHMAGLQRDVWKEMVDQGKSVAYQTADSNTFLRGPTRLKPEEVKFALRARASQLPTRAYLKKIQVSKVSRCRHCTADPETIAHILNHCPHNLDSKIKARHDKALERITTAIKNSVANRGKTLKIDSCPEDMETLLRPDIILRDDKRKKMTIADVAVVFEDYKKNSFGAARINKEEKYQSLKTHYEKRGYRVTVQALVYGSLGCIAQENKKVLTKELGIADRTAWAIQRAISTDCIRHSYQIWGFHVADNGTRQARGGGRSRANTNKTA